MLWDTRRLETFRSLTGEKNNPLVKNFFRLFTKNKISLHKLSPYLSLRKFEKQQRKSGILKRNSNERETEGGGGGGFEIPRSPRTCSFRALFPFHPMPSFLPAPLCLTPGALCIRISSGTSTWRSPLPSPAK